MRINAKERRAVGLAGRLVLVAAAVAALAAGTTTARAWGPHTEITKAALDVLPEAERWKKELGAENLAAFTTYCWMPDHRGQEAAAYYVDDYLLIRPLPTYAGHVMPDVWKNFEPYYRRALQALRTETPANACRQIGPLLHFCEDIGAPPHTGPRIPQHGPLENWVNARDITIAGYKPQLLGKTDDEALAGLLKRLEGLRAFSAERKNRALPLVEKGEAARPQVEPILLESANESARVAADMLYTVFTVGLAKQPAGAALEGTIEAAALPGKPALGARVVLLDAAKYAALEKAGTAAVCQADAATDFTTLATPAEGAVAAGPWRGDLKLRNLPAGEFRVLAYRPGARWAVSEPVRLEAGKTAKVRLTLPPTDPSGNLLLNPDGTLAYLSAAFPDRWGRAATTTDAPRRWQSFKVALPAAGAYRCGAVVKDPKAHVSFAFTRRDPADKTGKKMLTERHPLPTGEARPAEVRVEAEKGSFVSVTVDLPKPLTEAVKRVWVVAEKP